MLKKNSKINVQELAQVMLSVTFLMLCGGCGGSEHNKESSISDPTLSVRPIERSDLKAEKGTEDLSESAKQLGLRIVSEAHGGTNPFLPDPSVDLTAFSDLDDYTLDGSEIVIHKKLFLADLHSPNPQNKRNLFLVWPDDSYGSPLISASYTHRTLGVNDHLGGTLRPLKVWHDSDHRRWFIPLSEIFDKPRRGDLGLIDGATSKDVDPAATQLLTLELAPLNKAIRTLTIRFQAVGQLPQVVLADAVGPGSDLIEGLAPPTFVNQTSNQGIIIKKETISNPLPKEFLLWIKESPQDSSLILETRINSSFYTPHTSGLTG